MWTVLKQVGIFVFLANLSKAHTFNTGSLLKSSWHTVSTAFGFHPDSGLNVSTYGNSDQQARPLDLAHMRDGPGVMGLETPDNLPARADDADVAIVGAQKEAVGTRAHGRDLVALEEELRLVVGELNLRDIEEVESFPLCSR
jgi:hypothetical protein